MRYWLASFFALALLANSASAQHCATLPIPRAPDMMGQGYWYWDAYGQLQGPVYYVRPNFAPFQGMLPGPSATQCYSAYGMQAAGGSPGGYPGLWFHPNVRSPRDFFMMGDDPAASPYRYGAAASDR